MAELSTSPVLVYADGSCEGNPGPGGWGVVIVTPDETHRLSGGDSQTTNNRMEIMAAIEALRALNPGVPVILRSDSQYLVKTMNEGWRRTKNLDLWKQLDGEVARHEVRFEWVRGHAGDPRNEEADALAREAARSAAEGRTPRRSGDASGASATPSPLSVAGRVVQSATRPATESGETAPTASERWPLATASGAEGAAKAAPPAPLGSFDGVDESSIMKLEVLLAPDERIARCAACKLAFVARGVERYCSRVACQVSKRT